LFIHTDLTGLQRYSQLLKAANNRSSFRALQTAVFQPFENKKVHSSLFPLFLLPKTSIFVI